MSSTYGEDFGPLPVGGRQESLEQLSLNALRSSLPQDKFLFRDERVDDKGVDGTLETKIPRVGASAGTRAAGSHFTNCRSQVQLKSTDISQRNSDGTVSHPVETSNLNYLLNGPSPLYLLWIAPDDELRYAWARDESHRLETTNPDWRQQSSVTIRFARVVDAAAWSEIHERILKEARFGREISKVLARSSLSEAIHVRIDPQTLRITDMEQMRLILRESGMTMVSAGFAREALDGIDLLNMDIRREPRMQLVAAYAQMALGRYQAALGHVAEATMQRLQLAPHDQQFLEHLHDTCAYYTGRIGFDDFQQRASAWAQRQGPLAVAEQRLESLKWERLRSRDPYHRDELLAQMRTEAAAIDTAEDASGAHKLQARLTILFAEGDDLSGWTVEAGGVIRARDAMGYSSAEMRRTVANDFAMRWEAWRQDSARIQSDAVQLGHPLLMADSMSAHITTLLALISTVRLDAVAQGQDWAAPHDALSALMSEAEAALNIFVRADNLEGICRIKLQLAELFDLAGQEQASRALAEGVLPVADAMGYIRHEANAREFITGDTLYKRFAAHLAERHSQDEDVLQAAMSDEDVRSLARHTIMATQLPTERLEVVERSWRGTRRIAQERLTWCRQLSLLENLAHEASPETYYKTDPPRICVCEQHPRYRSTEHIEPSTVIENFKAQFCTGCPDRSPKNR